MFCPLEMMIIDCVLDTNGKLRYRRISAEEQPTRFAESKTKSPLRAKHNSIFMMVEIFSQIAHPNTKLVTRSRFTPRPEIIEHIVFGEGTKCYLVGGVHIGSMSSVTLTL